MLFVLLYIKLQWDAQTWEQSVYAVIMLSPVEPDQFIL